MKRLLIVIVLSITLLFSCTKPLDNIVILKVKDKNVNSDTNATVTTPVMTTTTTDGVTNTTDKPSVTTTVTVVDGERVLIINKSSKKIHLSDECSYAGKISEVNKITASFAELYTYLENGYDVCSYCEKHY